MKPKLLAITTMALALAFGPALPTAKAEGKVWEVEATKDQTFKVKGQKKPVITAKAGETITLHITAHKGPEQAKDGAVHSFTIKELADEGWNVRLKEGMNEVTLKAPAKPGEYVIECTVKCGPNHADQKMKLVVTS